ncbi:hypothetical protein GFO_3064 [Christiangramia forsetii KT0803]|uniref:Uncharacterized protein n=1 Tax=Christiangramia forsetii (strain DSM 17595 / CGMCC 1.15422 / KT0803) TaxID=411154 RepID=A0M5W3_CHRFK|nr:hypothetical protein GFO_3064 [Christiangramia forsetii KT0803]
MRLRHCVRNDRKNNEQKKRFLPAVEMNTRKGSHAEFVSASVETLKRVQGDGLIY